eukprot:TRINITY_DN11115_c0_g1_i1.p1 TRINITY_DN11115_c0_g1~~TRINITY_DN11115_c0_g1_i1.p1  ORF type:complete len:1487 (+),score=225.40 TRINITY_DN11115_c0_g1_i1:62-4522(+)
MCSLASHAATVGARSELPDKMEADARRPTERLMRWPLPRKSPAASTRRMEERPSRSMRPFDRFRQRRSSSAKLWSSSLCALRALLLLAAPVNAQDCNAGYYPIAELIVDCDGSGGVGETTITINLKAGEPVLVGVFPKGLAYFKVKLRAEASFSIALNNTAEKRCIVGRGCEHADFCTDATEPCHSYDPSKTDKMLSYSGVTQGNTKELQLGVPQALTVNMSLSWIPTETATGTIEFKYGRINPCPRVKPGCRECSEYTGCPDGLQPTCDGSALSPEKCEPVPTPVPTNATTQAPTAVPTLAPTLTSFAAYAPLLPLDPNPACLCEESFNEGWYPYDRTEQNETGRPGTCRIGLTTTCGQCPEQSRCSLIYDYAGSGLPGLVGDCPLDNPVKNECASPDKASMSYPAAIAMDEMENLYIADHKNNRIRAVSREKNYVMTIGGNGDVGFYGDGGYGVNAALRHPEGVAVRTNDNGVIEVFFSDVLNQRIRRLTEPTEAESAHLWMIDTVLGNGVRGSNEDCLVGCVASTAVLNNPRALAFSEAKELYVVDSGSRRIYRLTSNLTWYRRFVGINRAEFPLYDPLMAHLLPGHFKEPNELVVMETVHAIRIDRNQNLWFGDSSRHSLWMTPTDEQYRLLISGLVGVALEAYMLHFTSSHAQRMSIQNETATNIQAWLLATGQIAKESKWNEHPDTKFFKYGMSYWRYGTGDGPMSSTWCPELGSKLSRDQCTSKPADTVGFLDIKGICFSQANDMYVVDMEAGEVVVLETAPPHTFAITENQTDARTCKCLKYWVYPQSIGLNSSWPPEHCAQNPDAVDPFFPPGHAQAGQPVNCSTTFYCNNVPVREVAGYEQRELYWCMTDTNNESGDNYCADPALRFWDYCDMSEDTVAWETIPYASMLGHEIRDIVRFSYTWLQWEAEFGMVSEKLTDNLWYDSGSREPDPAKVNRSGLESYLTHWSILEGFVLTAELSAELSRLCPNNCCGLEQLGEEVLDDGSMSYICKLNDKNDLRVLTAILNPPDHDGHDEGKMRRISTLWRSSPPHWPGQFTEEDCRSLCLQDTRCTAIMVEWNKETRTIKTKLNGTWTQCYFYQKAYAYHLYKFNRSSWLKNETLVANWTTKEAREYRRFFMGPMSVYPRMFGEWSDAHVDSTEEFYMSGPHSEEGLLLEGCMDLCIRKTGCNTIAFPGCYLLSRTSKETWVEQLPEVAPPTGRSYSALIVKKNMGTMARGIIGYPGVRSDTDDDSYDGKPHTNSALLNRPLDCTVGVDGNLYILDTWNQRVRQVTKMQTQCMYTKTSSGEEVQEFVEASRQVHSKCAATPEMADAYRAVQETVVDKEPTKASLTDFSEQFCYLKRWAGTGDLEEGDPVRFLADYTTNMIVLCAVCNEEYDPPYGNATARSLACPTVEQCECQQAMANALKPHLFDLCKPSDAYFDKWHRWMAAYITCYNKDTAELEWMQDVAKKTSLINRLDSYSSYMATTTTEAPLS